MPIIQKVIDPTKIVTDELVLKRLAEQGIDKDYVEFWHDYAPRSKGKEYNPYAKFYRDLKSGKKFGVFSGLPMVKVEGHKIECGWLYAKGKYYSKANLFSAIVDGKQVQLTCLSNQPTGAKKNDRVIYKPQLFIGGSEILNGEQPTLLLVDPINENYKENTLEWAYGNISERRIRIIEGHYWDKFFILSHPYGRVSVKNNIKGNLKLKLGTAIDAKGNPLRVSVIGDEEIIEASEFDKAVYPVEIGASATYYPDAHEETSSVDGYVRRSGVDETLATIRGDAGTSHNDELTWMAIHLWASTTTNQFKLLTKNIMLFDTSGLPDTAIISAATLSVYGEATGSGLGKFDHHICASTPASNTDLVNADYGELGSTSFGSYAFDDHLTDYNNIALNASGIANISKTDISKFGARSSWDISGSFGGVWVSGAETKLVSWTAERGTGFKPKLVVTYTDHKLVTPSTLALTLTAYAPTVEITEHVTVTPSTLALILTTYSPTVLTPRLVTPPTLALSLTAYAPSINIGRIVTPTTLALTLMTFAPTIAITAHQLVTPSTLALILTTYAPTISTPRLVTPTTLALLLTLYAPGVIVPARILKLYVITSQPLDIKAITSQHRNIKTITSEHRKVKVITSGG